MILNCVSITQILSYGLMTSHNNSKSVIGNSRSRRLGYRQVVKTVDFDSTIGSSNLSAPTNTPQSFRRGTNRTANRSDKCERHIVLGINGVVSKQRIK